MSEITGHDIAQLVFDDTHFDCNGKIRLSLIYVREKKFKMAIFIITRDRTFKHPCLTVYLMADSYSINFL